MYETTFGFIKGLVMAIVLTPFGLYTGSTFGIYTGAITIAMIASLARLAYTKEKASLRLFSTFYIISLSITLLMVHVGLLREWDTNTTIILSGLAAFLGKDLLDILISSKTLLATYLTRGLK